MAKKRSIVKKVQALRGFLGTGRLGKRLFSKKTIPGAERRAETARGIKGLRKTLGGRKFSKVEIAKVQADRPAKAIRIKKEKARKR